MKKHFLMLLLAVSTVVFVGCQYDDEIDPPNYITFERNNAVSLGVDIGGTTSHEITVYTANVTSNERTFNLLVNEATTLDAAGYDLPSSVTVPGGTNQGTFTVEVADMNLGLTGKKLVMDLAESNVLSAGAPYTVTVNRTCEGREFVIDFKFDGYASELTWKLADSNGTVLVTGGGYKDGAATASRSLCLDKGTYTFTVADAYGDGLTYPTTGSITLSYAGTVLTVIDGDYGAGTSVDVTF